MKLLFLGSANGLSASLDNYQSNMVLITASNKKLLIDCGTDIRFSLAAAHLGFDDIDATYISHLHADHAGGLEWLGLNRKFSSQKPKPELIIHEQLVSALWDNCLSGGLNTLSNEKASLASFFKVRAVKENQSFTWEDIELELVKTVHMVSDGQLMPTFGLLIKDKESQFFITTDTQFTPDLLSSYFQQAQLIFHDCETTAYMSGVHAHFEQLKTLSPEIKAKTWLYHYSDGPLPNAVAAGFLGFIKPRQLIELNC